MENPFMRSEFSPEGWAEYQNNIPPTLGMCIYYLKIWDTPKHSEKYYSFLYTSVGDVGTYYTSNVLA